jgi:hypothetical protein
MVLLGAALYLLDGGASAGAHRGGRAGPPGTTGAVTHAYSGHANAFGWAAGWFSVVLLGRVLLVVGLRAALAHRARLRPLLDLAVVAMTVSVALEVVTYAVAAGAAAALSRGASSQQVAALDSVSWDLDLMVYGPLGVSVLVSALAMWRSGLFSRVLCGAGGLAGVALVVQALLFSGPDRSSVAEGLQAGVLLFWIWMIWTAVVVWRRRPPGAAREAGVGLAARRTLEP